MTQDERWYANWKEVMDFMEAHKRRPSKYDPEERNQWNWLRHTQKLHNAGGLKPERVEKLAIVDFRHDSTMIKRAYHCARCSESLENFWN